jgi:hypothetical protein
MLEATKGAVYICMSSSEIGTLKRAFEAAGGHWSTFIVWAKNAFTLGRSDYQRQYEPILYGWPKGSDHFWCGARDQGDVWQHDRPVKNDLHPTMKPVALVERAIRNSSKRQDIVLDRLPAQAPPSWQRRAPTEPRLSLSSTRATAMSSSGGGRTQQASKRHSRPACRCLG